MAIFTAEEYGGIIKECWLDKKNVTRLATCAGISNINIAATPPPPGVVIEARPASLLYYSNEDGTTGVVIGRGWVDILKADVEGHIIANDEGEPVASRHHGIVKLEWSNA